MRGWARSGAPRARGDSSARLGGAWARGMSATKPSVLLFCYVVTPPRCAGARWDPSALPVSRGSVPCRLAVTGGCVLPSAVCVPRRAAGRPRDVVRLWQPGEVVEPCKDVAHSLGFVLRRVPASSCCVGAAFGPNVGVSRAVCAPGVRGRAVPPAGCSCPTAGSSPQGHLSSGAGTTVLRAEVPTPCPEGTGLGYSLQHGEERQVPEPRLLPSCHGVAAAAPAAPGWAACAGVGCAAVPGQAA